jgi:hypothetical protein
MLESPLTVLFSGICVYYWITRYYCAFAVMERTEALTQSIGSWCNHLHGRCYHFRTLLLGFQITDSVRIPAAPSSHGHYESSQVCLRRCIGNNGSTGRSQRVRC